MDSDGLRSGMLSPGNCTPPAVPVRPLRKICRKGARPKRFRPPLAGAVAAVPMSCMQKAWSGSSLLNIPTLWSC